MEYQLCLDNLDQLIQFGFQINWTLLQIGYYGYKFIPKLLTEQDISSYAIEQLKLSNNKLVMILLACIGYDDYKFEQVLQKLIKDERVNKELQIRKWRVLLVFRCVKSLPDNYTDGLIELTELWISLGIPDDCPHIIQGHRNNLSPHEYYTQAMYNVLKKKNEEWLHKEILFIISQEK